MRKVYTPEHLRFLRENIKGRSLADLAKLFNKRFRLSKTPVGIKAFAQRHGLKSGYRSGWPGWNRKYLGKHVRFLEKNVPGRHYPEIAELFNRRFGFSVTPEQLASSCKRFGISTGFTGHFPKGNVPPNKGVKGVYHAGCEVSWFKKGHKPPKWRPVGSERINSYGYVEIKVSDIRTPSARLRQKNWKAKHVAIWEKANGPVPKGHVVIFLDGNKSNIVLKNLMMLSRQEHAVMCHMNLYTDDRETTKANCIMAQIKVAISNLKRKTFKAMKSKKIIFLNNNGYKVYVIQEKGRYIPARETCAGNLVRLRVKKLKPRASRSEAQRDLYEYALFRGWMRI